MKRATFDEQTMRKYENVNSAIKVYSQQGISTRRIILLYNQTWSIEIGTMSVNVNFLQSSVGEKFVEKYVGKSEARKEVLKKAVDAWKNKFNTDDVKKRQENAVARQADLAQIATEKASA
jgi:hypothetical protein